MKYALLLIVVAVMTYVFRNVFTKRDKRRAVRSVSAWLVPAGVGLIAVIALIFFNLNFNGKVI
jgi:hypothetical protein